MISVENAKKLILKNVNALSASNVKLADAVGCLLFEDVVSPVNLPPFDQSAMDGYAIKYADFIQNTGIKIEGEVPAGDFYKKELTCGHAVKIFTGAPVPAGADTIVIKEKVSAENGNIIIDAPLLKQGANIRKTGSQIKKGIVALRKKTILTPGGVGYLAAMGISTVKVYAKPSVSLVVTGNELVKPGKLLNNGQVYESNSYALESALKLIGLDVKNNIAVKDNLKGLSKTLRKVMKNSNIVLITGGISVGDYDFTGKALSELGVKTIFYKIKQKPGKPLFFGKYGETLIFGMPGNPAAVLTCFYEYVYPTIKLMRGLKNAFLPKIYLPMGTNFSKQKGVSLFLKGKLSNNVVNPLDGQESFILSSFAAADCLIYLPEKSEDIKKGDLVELHQLPEIY